MNDYKIEVDPARIHAGICEARRLRNAVLRDLFMAIFDGRLLARLTGERKLRADDLPRGTAAQG